MRYARAANNLQIIKLRKMTLIKLKQRALKTNNKKLYI